MIKIYKDTDILINEGQDKITIVRGYWNFNQVNLDISDMKNKKHIIDMFRELNNVGEFDESKLDKEFQSDLLQLVSAGLFYKTDEVKNGERKILFITDELKFIQNKLSHFLFKENIQVIDKKSFDKDYLNDKSINDIKQDPILEHDIKVQLTDYINANSYNAISIFLTKVDDDFCNVINCVLADLPEIEINYCLFDKDFTYLFGVKKLYTGCYSCFSKRMAAKMKTVRTFDSINNVERQKNEGYKEYLMDFSYALLDYNMEEYIRTGMSPMLGRISAIFNSTLEVKYENLLRLSFCPECGYIGRSENKERNIKLANFMKELHSHD